MTSYKCDAVYAGPSFPEKHGTKCVRVVGHTRRYSEEFHWSADGLSWLDAEQKKKIHAGRELLRMARKP